jgi:hypothetical protein
MQGRARDVLPLALGVAAIAVGTLLGWDSHLLERVVTPPALVRALLAVAAGIVGLALLARSVTRIGQGGGASGERDLPAMVRGVRLAFLAVAAFAAAAGWVIGHPLPIVVALVIAGVDVVETSFLLLVVQLRGR